jgi:multidrug efflux pump
MSIGTFFTLIVMPSIYILLAKDHMKDRAKEAAVKLREDELKPATA